MWTLLIIVLWIGFWTFIAYVSENEGEPSDNSIDFDENHYDDISDNLLE